MLGEGWFHHPNPKPLEGTFPLKSSREPTVTSDLLEPNIYGCYRTFVPRRWPINKPLKEFFHIHF